MKNNKTKKANLESKKGIFLQLGLLTCLLLAITTINWRTIHTTVVDQVVEMGNIEDLDLPPVTKPKKKEVKKEAKPKPKKKIDFTKINLDSLVVDTIVLDTNFVDTAVTRAPIFIPVEPEPEGPIRFELVEGKPRFTSCADVLAAEQKKCFFKEISKHISKSVRKPARLQGISIQGKVWVAFVIDKAGNVQDVKVIRGVNEDLDQEAIRVIESLPKFIPAYQRDKKVAVSFTIPINFNFM